MMHTLGDAIRDLPEKRRTAVIEGGKALVAEEYGLREMRKVRALTQASVGKALKADQATVSKIEKRSDMLVSTMRRYVEAAGGKIRIIAEFQDATIELAKIGVDGSVRKRALVPAKATEKIKVNTTLKNVQLREQPVVKPAASRGKTA